MHHDVEQHFGAMRVYVVIAAWRRNRSPVNIAKSREMHHRIDLMRGKNSIDRRGITNVPFDQLPQRTNAMTEQQAIKHDAFPVPRSRQPLRNGGRRSRPLQ
jgi:hypothetical protein